jgi:hypothetical protein
MHRSNTSLRAAFVATLAATLAAAALAAPPTNGKSSCEVCHSKIAAAYAPSIHATGHMTCVDCHGGDPKDMGISAMSARAGFKPTPTRKQIPLFCSRCHSNAGLMKQHGLPAHQFEDYQTSGHGQAWARGDGKAAVCTDCHGSHGLRAADDTNSMVYRANVAKTCARCHADAKLMARYGLPSNVYADYEKSSHAKMLKAGGRLAAPSCPQCHGSHTALPPMVGQVHNVCGQCHRPIVDLVYDNVHAAATRAGRFGQCISCHDNHAILPPKLSMLHTTCAQCHAQGSAAAQLGGKLEQLVLQAQGRYAKAEEDIERLAVLGADTQKLGARMEEASMVLKQIATDQHTLSLEKTEQDILAVESISDEIDGDAIEYLKTLRLRRLALIPVWAYLLLCLGLVYWKRRRLDDNGARGSAAPADRGGG